MATLAVSIFVKAPTDVVFGLATDLENFAKTIRAITRIDKLTPGPVGVGTRFRETRVMFGREATEEMEFVSFEPNKGYTLTAHSCGYAYRSELSFTPQADGTQVTMTFGGRPETFLAWLMTPLGWLLRGTMKKCIKDDLEDLRRAAESPVPTA